jgi:predicted alpha-1,2-mannosidase
MRAILCSILLCSSLWAAAPYDSVNPFIGTANDGNTFPAATLPLGMVQWGPDTRPDGWYRYDDKSIRGFSLTHISGAGCPIYADVPILPGSGQALPLDHAREQAHPGFYSIGFPDGMRVELTATARAGMGRFTFPPGDPPTLYMDAGGSATQRKQDSATIEIRGNEGVVGAVHSGGFCGMDDNYTLYFVATFNKPVLASGAWAGRAAGTFVSFRPGVPLLVKVGISFVSIANAELNLNAEIPGWDFDAVHAQATSAWSELLNRIEVEGGTAEERTIFYTGVYHMMLAPNLFSDVNGQYPGFDGQVHRVEAGHAQYANFSDWDIYRSLVQWDALVVPGQTGDMMQSLVRDAEQSGWLPRWPVANDVSYVMGGDSSAILLASAHAFGVRSFDTASALRSMIKGATEPGVGLHGKAERPGLADYLKLGYLALGSEVKEFAASVTLEYASADFAVSRFAAALGDKATAARLLRSAQNWRNLLDPETGFIRPRTSDGKFLGGWDPDRLLPHLTNWDTANQLGFEEGSTWQYTWMIPHNYAGLFRAMGGNGVVLPKLDKFFEKVVGWGTPNFTVANEPDFVAPFAYVWAGVPWKTQEVEDRIRREAFGTTPGGLPGNDDLGATSGVYVWDALGLYPVIPGVGGLALGTPLFRRAIVPMGEGRSLEIVSSGEGIYVQSVKLNGKPYPSAWLPLAALADGRNRLEFVLGKQPNKEWATGAAELPPSFDVEEQ